MYLTTLHKFNDWTDLFLNANTLGLEDLYLSLSGKLADGKVFVAYHYFSKDESNPSIDDLGGEIYTLYAKIFGKKYSAGITYGPIMRWGSASDKVWLESNF